jgi:uncharacterized protein involved in exopolysaccharide biosynthesis
VSNSDDELDLLPYFQSILRNWWLILLTALLFAIVFFGYSAFREKKYQATASILMTRTRAALSIAEQFPTLNEPIDTRSRMDAIFAIANSDSVSQKTFESVQSQYPNEDLNINDVKNSVKLSITGDMIDVSASSSLPEMAADIANTWAKHGVDAVNYAYSGEQLPDEIQLRLEPARKVYEEAQAELEAFLENSQVSLLERQIYEANTTIDELVKDRSWQIAYNIQRKQQMEQVIDQAEALKEQLQAGNQSPAGRIGTAIAIMRLQSGGFAETVVNRDVNPISTSGDPAGENNFILNQMQPDLINNIQISELVADGVSNREFIQDLDQIIDQGEQEKEKAEANLTGLTTQTENSVQDQILEENYRRVQELQAKLEEEEARLEELTNQRDLARTTFAALAEKETEVRNNLETSNSVVLASPAVTPGQPVNTAMLRNTAIAGSIGLILAILIILSIHWLRSIKQLSQGVEQKQVTVSTGSTHPR